MLHEERFFNLICNSKYGLICNIFSNTLGYTTKAKLDNAVKKISLLQKMTFEKPWEMEKLISVFLRGQLQRNVPIFFFTDFLINQQFLWGLRHYHLMRHEKNLLFSLLAFFWHFLSYCCLFWWLVISFMAADTSSIELYLSLL